MSPNFWRHRSALDQILVLVSIIAVILPSQIVAKDLRSKFHQRNEKNDVCLTKECNKIASEILKFMNSTVKPCDNFYQFACGNFIKNTKLPEDKATFDIFTRIRDKLKKQLQTLLNEGPSNNVTKSFNFPYYFYKACMNEDLIETQGIEPMTKITESMGGWPAIKGDKWNESSWLLQSMIKSFYKFGFDTDLVIGFSVFLDLKNSTKHILNLYQPDTNLKRPRLVKGLKGKNIQAYFSYMVDIAVLFGADRKRAETELKDTLQFEIDIANISLPDEELLDITTLYNLMTIEQIQKKYPYIDWLNYINALLPQDLNVNKDEIVNVWTPIYFEKLRSLLEKTPKRTIANYMMWSAHMSSLQYLTKELRNRKLQFDKVLDGVTKQKPRWEKCLDYLKSNTHMTVIIDHEYVNRYFDHNSKKSIVKLFKNVKNELKMILQKVTWMDDKTKLFALDKLKKMTNYMGYSEQIKNVTKLIEHYKPYLNLNLNNFFESMLVGKLINKNYENNNLRKPVDKNDFMIEMRPSTANAAYITSFNKINLPAGILQDRFFSAERPKYMNYGGIGVVIGHELTHAFDNDGRQMDGNGNIFDWWQENTKKLFIEKTKCMIEQYSNYTDTQTGLKLNGELTQGENIADNGGVKQSYFAYKNWSKYNGPEQRLPRLNKYSPEQMFWISYAQSLCEKSKREYVESSILEDQHTISEYRVIGTLQNMKEFSNDFKCPKGSPMNPANKCEIW